MSEPIPYDQQRETARELVTLPDFRQIECDVPVITVLDPKSQEPYKTIFPEHRLAAAINEDIKVNGTKWNKCPNCGDLYKITPEWPDPTVCSRDCYQQYRDYVSNPNIW